jgi:hypothetical protein
MKAAAQMELRSGRLTTRARCSMRAGNAAASHALRRCSFTGDGERALGDRAKRSARFAKPWRLPVASKCSTRRLAQTASTRRRGGV